MRWSVQPQESALGSHGENNFVSDIQDGMEIPRHPAEYEDLFYDWTEIREACSLKERKS